MFVIKWLLLALATLALAVLAAGQLGWFKGTAPTNLGVREGRLKLPSSHPTA